MRWNKDKEIGDFVVRFYSDCCAIKGTTAEGNTKRFLVIPECIDGVPVVYLGIKRTSIIGGNIGSPEIRSDAPEEVFFESEILAYSAAFSHCPSLKKVMFVSGEAGALSAGLEKFCYPYKKFKTDYGHIENYYNNGFWKIPANVSYYYNYENAANDGYYWIDDCDYGGSIEFVLKEPSRNGYTFGGWYREAECQSKWNFETDRLPERNIAEGSEFDEDDQFAKYYYQETILYAKWM